MSRSSSTGFVQFVALTVGETLLFCPVIILSFELRFCEVPRRIGESRLSFVGFRVLRCVCGTCARKWCAQEALEWAHQWRVPIPSGRSKCETGPDIVWRFLTSRSSHPFVEASVVCSVASRPFWGLLLRHKRAKTLPRLIARPSLGQNARSIMRPVLRQNPASTCSLLAEYSAERHLASSRPVLGQCSASIRRCRSQDGATAGQMLG